MSEDSDHHFVELVIREMMGQATAAEQQELRDMVSLDPRKRDELAQVQVAREALTLCAAAEAPGEPLPPEALKKVRAIIAVTITRPRSRSRIAVTMVIMVLCTLVILLLGWSLGLFKAREGIQHSKIGFQIALYEANPTVSNGLILLPKPMVIDAGMLRKFFPEADVVKFSEVNELDDWRSNWPRTDDRTVAKISLERSASALALARASGQIRVVGKSPTGTFQKTFSVATSGDWLRLLEDAKEYVIDQTNK